MGSERSIRNRREGFEVLFLDSVLLLVCLSCRKARKNMPLKKGGLIAIVCFALMLAFVNIWAMTGHMNMNNQPVKAGEGPWFLAAGGLAVDVVTILLAVLTILRMNKEKQHASRNDLALRLYRICAENGISGADTDEDQRGIRLVASGSLGIAEKDAVPMFLLGKEAARTEQHRNEQKALEEEAQSKKTNTGFIEQRWNELRNRQRMIGKDKYIQPFYEHYEDCRRSLAGANKSVAGFERTVNTMFRETNSAAAGGLAQGIGGIGAGLAAYAEAEQRNASTRAAKSQFLRSGVAAPRYDTRRFYKEKVEKYEKFLPWFSQWMEHVQIDKDVDPALFGDVELTAGKQENYKDTDYLIVSITSVNHGEYSVLRHPARLDGTVRVDVYERGKKVGEGFYSPRGYGTTDLTQVGFAHEKPREVLIRPMNGAALRADRSYEFRFSPEHLWLIQAKKADEEKVREISSSGVYTLLGV